MQEVFEPYYLAVYKVTPHEENKQFSLPWHGNTKKHSHAPPYFPQDPATVAAIVEKLKKVWPTEKVYINLTKKGTDTLSETLKNPKIINKKKYKLNNKTIESPEQENEDECIVKYLKKKDSFVKSFHLDHCEYNTAH